MRSWIASELRSVREGSRGLKLILDPDGLMSHAELGELAPAGYHETRDWLELRRAYEETGRSPDGAEGVLIVIRSDDFRDERDLPYDIGQQADVAVVRLSIPEPMRSLVLALPDHIQDRAVGAATGPDPLGRLLEELWGVRLPRGSIPAAAEIAAVIELRLDPAVPDELWPLIQDRLSDRWAVGLASQPVDIVELQAAWERWARAQASEEEAAVFVSLGPKLMTLFHVGMLDPVEVDRELPRWATSGARAPSWYSRAGSLLAAPPVVSDPQGFSDWLKLAEWWAEVRLAISLGAPETAELADAAWEQWEGWDTQFRQFLHQDFGKLLSSSAGRPQVVHRIAPYLARRLRDGSAERVLLVVFDGMGFPHWSLMRGKAQLTVAESSGVLAMAPSLTPISRQSIFAGALPLSFSAQLRDTQGESALWTRFWENEGLPVGSVGYYNMEGVSKRDVPSFHNKQVFGLVVRALDELMHTSEMLGEAQFADNVQTWMRHGFVGGLVQAASSAGYEIWFTADHGSLEVIPQGRPMEGLAVDVAGTRVRLYETPALRAQSKAGGDAWDPPGMPPEGPYPLFAWGRFGMRHDVRITHGGLSFDEMIVPLVRVEP